LIVDTNALSAAADEDSTVFEMFARAEQVVLPVIVLGEYRYGIAQSRHRARYKRWLDGLIADCRVLDIDEGTTHYYASVNVELRRGGKPIPTNDLWIAALCRQHLLPVLSRDKHFDLVSGIRRLTW
jgi:tRNA(fMet)-specific endonuclease VapC